MAYLLIFYRARLVTEALHSNGEVALLMLLRAKLVT